MSGGQRYSSHLLISMLAKTYGGFIEGFNAPKTKIYGRITRRTPLHAAGIPRS